MFSVTRLHKVCALGENFMKTSKNFDETWLFSFDLTVALDIFQITANFC